MKILVLANNDVGLYHFRKELLQKLLDEGHYVFIALPGGEKVIRFMRMGCVFFRIEIDRRGINPAKDIVLLNKYKITYILILNVIRLYEKLSFLINGGNLIWVFGKYGFRL